MTDVTFPAFMAACFPLPQLLDVLRAPKLVRLLVALTILAAVLVVLTYELPLIVPDPYGRPLSLALMLAAMAGAALLALSGYRRLPPNQAHGPDNADLSTSRTGGRGRMKYFRPACLIGAFVLTTLILIEVYRINSIMSGFPILHAAELTTESKINIAILVTIWVLLLVGIIRAIRGRAKPGG